MDGLKKVLGSVRFGDRHLDDGAKTQDRCCGIWTAILEPNYSCLEDELLITGEYFSIIMGAIHTAQD